MQYEKELDDDIQQETSNPFERSRTAIARGGQRQGVFIRRLPNKLPTYQVHRS
jgi:hypothetical protein